MAVVDPLENAKKAAAAAAAPHAGKGLGGCPACDKAGLPILLVRPGLASKTYSDQVAGAIGPLLQDTADPVELYSPHHPASSGSPNADGQTQTEDNPTIPGRLASGYVARTLRAGYLHLYYESPQTASITAADNWQMFRVSDGGYLSPYPVDDHRAETKADEFSCSQSPNYATAMLMTLAEQDLEGRVWIGFADHPWSAAVRQRYAGDEALRDQRMTCMTGKSCPASAQLTEKFVSDNILDYAERPVRRKQSKGMPFEPKDTREESPDLLMDRARWIIEQSGSDDLSIDDARVVGIADPVGVTTETAVRRVLLPALARDWLLKQADQPTTAMWKLQSAIGIDHLVRGIQSGGIRSVSNTQRYRGRNNTRLPLGDYRAQRQRYDDAIEAGQAPDALDTQTTLPPEAIAVRFPQDPHYAIHSDVSDSTADDTQVFVQFVQRQAQAEETARTLRAIEDNLRGGDATIGSATFAPSLQGTPADNRPAFDQNKDYRVFLETYKDKSQADLEHKEALDKDYCAWLNSGLRQLVTTNDFDENDPSDGAAYVAAVSSMFTHSVQTRVSREAYQAFLTDDIDDTENLLGRALAGNYAPHFDAYRQAAAAVPENRAAQDGDSAFTNPISQKSVDGALKTLLGLEIAENNLNPHARRFLQYAVAGHAAPLLAVAGTIATVLEQQQQMTARLRGLVQKMALALMDESLPKGTVLTRVSATGDRIVDALRAMRHSMGGLSRQNGTMTAQLEQQLPLFESQGMQRLRSIRLSLYTWTRALPENAGAATPYTFTPIVNGSTQASVRLSQTTAFSQLRQSLPVLKSAGVLLSIATIILNGQAIAHATDALRDADTDKDQALLSLGSAVLGTSGAMLQLWGHSKNALQGVTAKDLQAVGTRWGVNLGGIVSGVASFVAAYQMWVNASVLRRNSDTDSAIVGYVGSALLMGSAVASIFGGFAGFSTTGYLLAIAASIWNVVGFVLLLAGLMALLVSAFLKDGPAARWAAKSIWGTGERYASYDTEREAMQKLLLGFSMDLTASNDYWKIVRQPNAPGNLAGTLESRGKTSDIVLTINLGAAQDMPWTYTVEGLSGARCEVLATNSHAMGGAGTPAPQGNLVDTDDDGTVEQHVEIPSRSFSRLTARVRLFRESRDQPVIDQTIELTR